MSKSEAAVDAEDVSTVTRPAEARVEVEAFVLDVVDGPDRGCRFVVDPTSPARVLVGQSPACDLRLSDRAVSRRHVALELEKRGLRITDLDSTNGTLVNGMPVVQMFLQGGELVRLGGTTIRVEARVTEAGANPPTIDRFGRFLGASPQVRRLYPICERLAQSDVPVIIEGETGTGKEVLAESLHECGPRAAGPFVVFDCTAVAPSLVESELFGHERGAFTGATSARKGFFEQAHRGTLLIDEIGDLDLSLQPKLLRAIERSQIRRVGGDRAISVEVRIVAATRRDLDHEVQVGRFRDDLFHRLAVARVELPPLRKRRGDVRVLVQHFCRELGADPEAIAKRIVPLLRRWEDDLWPGNVRELRNAVARQLAIGDITKLDDAEAEESESAPLAAQNEAPAHDLIGTVLALKLPFGRARERVLEEFRRRYVEQVLAEHGGSVVRAAAASGVGRRYFQRVKARRRDG